MKHLDNLHSVPPTNAINNSIWAFYDLANVSALVIGDDPTRHGKRPKLIAALQNTVDGAICMFLGIP